MDGAKRRAARLALCALLAGSGTAAVALPATAVSLPGGCAVTFSPQYWPGGFTLAATVTNLGPAAWTGWTLRFDWRGDQRISNGWSGNWTQSGAGVTVSQASWNGQVGPGGAVQIGAQGSWSASQAVPNAFSVNGMQCSGPLVITPTSTTTSTPTSTASTTTPSISTTATTTTTGTTPHLDNPYLGVRGYLDGGWSARAGSVPGGELVANTSTAVWLDTVADIAGRHGRPGLREHLDAALAQGAGAIQVVLHDLPGRDCQQGGSTGDFTLGELARYQAEFVDPIAALEADPAYSSLRIINIVEPRALYEHYFASLVTDWSTEACRQARASGDYPAGISYALGRLHAAGPNTYQYLDGAAHGLAGWQATFRAYAQLLADTARAAAGGAATVDGVAVNVADYGATVEPYFQVSSTRNGTSVRQSKWVDWNDYVDEQSYALALRSQLVLDGLPASLGVALDTSRNGWGGAQRPAGPGSSPDLNTWVDQTRVDRRFSTSNWCNQSGAGLGERPRAAPGPAGIDAWAWITPPGRSDGAARAQRPDGSTFANSWCDPLWGGPARGSVLHTGVLPDAPQAGEWFAAHFRRLLDNAYPPLGTADAS